MIIKDLLEVKNHLGETEYTTFDSWKRAAKKKNAKVWFEGDKDIAQAMVGPKPFKKGETESIGEWDGAVGSLYLDDYSQGRSFKESLVCEGKKVCIEVDEHDAHALLDILDDKRLTYDLTGGKDVVKRVLNSVKKTLGI